MHAGILADLRLEDHREQLAELGVEPFDLVVVNLYPFRETVASGASPDECVEQIDIGGPSMVRAAAKNHPSVAVVTSPGAVRRRPRPRSRTAASTSPARKRLAAEAFRHTAAYDVAVASWFAERLRAADDDARFPDFLGADLRAHRTSCATARTRTSPPRSTSTAPAAARRGRAAARQGDVVQQLHGHRRRPPCRVRPRRALRRDHQARQPVRHRDRRGRRRGAPQGARLRPAVRVRRRHRRQPPGDAWRWPSRSPRSSPRSSSPRLRGRRRSRSSPGRRTSACCAAPTRPARPVEVKPIDGGALLQVTDRLQAEGDDPANWTLATGEALSADELAELAFAWRACRAVKSNAILLAKDGASVGVGMGQVNRVDSAKLAVERAGESGRGGSYAASDAFFPFPDGLEILHRRPASRPWSSPAVRSATSWSSRRRRRRA